VVQVSAHYPPNFTSGGTLVPQRVARGLVRRGHEVAVYAGYLDPAREPLTSWEETDPDGIRVRWIVTTPWTGWSDRHNFDNPAVAEHFEQWLVGERPDVVHLHSIQTLGGGLVAAAQRSGARVVVTMHDFWWTCARQFLVDPDGHPCSLVVDCGSCSCQVSHDWLTERNTWLAQQIGAADLILAPSQVAADVLIANGVDPTILRINENGVPDVAPVSATPERPRDPVRLLYAGGEDPMKGFETLREALPLVRTSRDWTIDLYNVSRQFNDPKVRSLPAFAPEDLTQVLAAHDVLVLPSVMRESHSILTREALSAGLPVICTDSLGPEEVVVEGTNGLVVASADAAALAAAMVNLVDDPDRLAVMSQRAAEVQIRTVDEQIDELEEWYVELLDGRHRHEAVSESALNQALDGLLRSVLYIVGIDGAPLRYRVHLPAEALGSAGVSTTVLHYRDPRVPAAAAAADVVIFYRVPATVQLLQVVEDIRARPRSVPVLYDVDDLIVDPELRGTLSGLQVLTAEQEELWWHGVARYRTMLEVADGFIGSTTRLCTEVGELTGMPTYRFGNGVGSVLAKVSERALAVPREPGPLRIGFFSGTTTHDADWAMVAPVIAGVMDRHPGVELWVGGHLTLGPGFEQLSGRVREFPMTHWTELPTRLRQLDINLAPLAGATSFNEAKSAIKWLEAALVGTPTVASATEPFREAITDGVTGFLATDLVSWEQSLSSLLDDDALRERMGSRARRAALLEWSPARQGRAYQSILRQALQRRLSEPLRVSPWSPVADDEPFDVATFMEPYPPAAASVRTAAWRRHVATVSRVYRAQGWRGVAQAVRRRVG